MKNLNLINLGPGKVGKTFLHQFFINKSAIEKKYSLKLKLLGVFNSTGGKYQKQGINKNEITKSFGNQNINKRNKDILKTPLPFVLIDTTASDETKSLLIKVLKKDGFVITSNKKPLSSDLKTFISLFKYRNRLFFETTVGAGLPIISTIQELIETGDKVLEIQGCFSGTLGYIFSLLQQGKKFSEAVIEAKKKGFTEPDPRDDLSGLDVARKALILSRILGRNLSLNEIKLTPLYPKNLDNLSVEEFLEKISSLDSYYYRLMMKARNNNKTLRFIAKINRKFCLVGLNQVDLNSDIGQLDGPDNIIVIRTKRYFKNPLVIKGPGAGPEVTAAGVFGDLLKIIKIVSL